jgi:hypothetical protein
MMFCWAAYAQQDSVSMYVGIDDVEITAPRQIVSYANYTGNISVNMDELNGVPRVGGAIDVLRLLQYTPGVAATQEGNTSLYVRGGDSGQSMVLINETPLYSPSHMLGLFSTLNTPHLSGLTLYKTSMPASYGSSSAAIIDVRTHRYVPQKITLEGNIGLIESDGALQLPIGNRFALFASARHSYSSWLTHRLASNATINYNFGDYGVGAVTDLGRAGRLVMNTHFNSDNAAIDVMMFNSCGMLKWWNGLGNISLDTELSESVTMANMVYGSIYDNLLMSNIISHQYDIKAGLSDFGYKNKFSIDLEDVDIEAGANYSFRRVVPQYISDISGFSASDDRVVENSSEIALYSSVKWLVHQNLSIDAGLRLSMFVNDRVWVYPEPRIKIDVPLSPELRLWASYNFMSQYIQLVPQSNMSFATDFYITSSKHLPPQLSHNFSLGYGQHALSGRLSWSAELYYRYMLNVIEYNSFLFDILMGVGNNHINMLHSGRGESYGIETNIAYNSSKFNVQLNYTLSRSVRQFDDINNGMSFFASSDRTHNLSLLSTYKPTPRWTFSATFTYATGAPYTEHKAVYISANTFIKELGSYNGKRLPDIHHLDLSVTYWFKSKRFKQNGINLSIYNVYAHANPILTSWTVMLHDDPLSVSISEKHHYLYTIVPSISWTFKF